MATYRANQNKKVYETLPYAPADSGEVKGKVLRMYEEFDLVDIGAAIADNDIILIGSKIPAGARMVDFKVVLPVDATGVLDFGWVANGVDAASDNGIIDGAANTLAIAEVSAGLTNKYKKFTAETQLKAVGETTFTGQVGVVKINALFVID